MANTTENWNEKEIIRNIGKHVKRKREIMGLTQENLQNWLIAPSPP